MTTASFHHFPNPAFDDEADYSRFREVLVGAGFTRDGVPMALRLPSFDVFRTLPRPTMAALTGAGRPVDCFVRLFLMNEPVSTEALARAVAPMKLEAWSSAGIISVQGQYAFPAMGVALFENLFLLHDIRAEVGETFVMGVAGTSAALAYQAIFAPGKLALDLGTGCGVLAFLAARQCERVLATDKNPRAIAIASFNARINGITNVDFAIGDLFEPVHEYLRRSGGQGAGGFDFIYCNPPFVIAPSGRYMYCDSGLGGDAIVEAVARGVGPLLNPGGVAQFVCNWMQTTEQPWEQRLSAWVKESGCDALVFRTRSVNPMDYASMWIEETEKGAAPEQRWQMLNQWMAAYEQLKLAAVHYGLFTMHKRAGGTPWLAFDDVPEHVQPGAGAHLRDMLVARNFLAGLGSGADADARLGDAVLACSPHLRVDQLLKPTGAAWKPDRIELRMARGYPLPRLIDQRQMELIMAIDGTRSVKHVVEGIAAASKAPPAALLPVVLKFCRQLMERALVMPLSAGQSNS